MAHLFPYLGIDQNKPPMIDVIVWGVDGNIVYSWSDWKKQ
jgi:hypothetical protein